MRAALSRLPAALAAARHDFKHIWWKVTAMRVPGKLLGWSAALVLWGVVGSSAQAQVGVNSRYSIGYGFLSTGPNLYGGESIPYFSMHPPVYYSAPVPRTYGYSPFAYPPGIMTPDIECAPAPILNPHVPQKATGAKTERTASVRHSIAPKLIYNPFVEQPHGKAVAELADRSAGDDEVAE